MNLTFFPVLVYSEEKMSVLYHFAKDQYYDVNMDDETKNAFEKCNLKESKCNYTDSLGYKMTEWTSYL